MTREFVSIVIFLQTFSIINMNVKVIHNVWTLQSLVQSGEKNQT